MQAGAEEQNPGLVVPKLSLPGGPVSPQHCQRGDLLPTPLALWGSTFTVAPCCGYSHRDSFWSAYRDAPCTKAGDKVGTGGRGMGFARGESSSVRPSIPARTTGSLIVSAGPGLPGREEAVLNLKETAKEKTKQLNLGRMRHFCTSKIKALYFGYRLFF